MSGRQATLRRAVSLCHPKHRRLLAYTSRKAFLCYMGTRVIGRGAVEMERSVSIGDSGSPSWHDNAIYGVRLDVGDCSRGDWRSDLVLDLDHIVEWVCGSGGQVQFRVAPATLTFHDVTDLRIAIDCGDSGHQTALHEWSIDAITRQPVSDQKICLDRPYYRWRIALNIPSGGAVTFGASGFTQVLRAAPVLLDQQTLSAADRR